MTAARYQAVPAYMEDVYEPSTMDDLYSIIPEEIAEATQLILQDSNNPEYEGSLKKAREYFENNSIVLNTLINNSGTSRFTEMVYGINSDEPREIIEPFIMNGHKLTEIDDWALRTMPCLGVKNRKEKLVEYTDKHIRRDLEKKDTIYIGNFGSGPGRDSIELVRRYPNVFADHIDTDEDALETSKKLADYYGIGDRVMNVKESMTALDKHPDFIGKYDYVFVMGIWCPHSPLICDRIQRKIYPTIQDGGLATISNASKVMGNGNDVSRFRETTVGWPLWYKDENDLIEITSKNGLFKPVEYFYDDYYQNVMVTVSKNGKR